MLRSLVRLAVVTVALVPVLGSAACSSAPATETEDTAASSAAITTSEVISRAEQWVAVKLKYCQAINGGRDYDSACSTYCNRQSNPQWDPYRSDCSGFVSWAWQLPAPGRVTGQFAPFVTDISHAILAKDLTEGDAVNNDHHIMIFKAWTVPGKTATFIEEPGCSSSTPYAHEFTSNVTLNGNSISVAWNGDTFTAIRYDKIQPADKPVQGALDAAACEGLAGWAQDPDSPDAPVRVTLDFDALAGRPNNAGSMDIVAADSRSDLCKAIGSCKHGFSVVVPDGLRDGKAHQVFATGQDLQNSTTTLLPNAPKSFTCAVPAMPIGVKRHVVDATSQKAWQIDPKLDIAHEPAAAVAALPEGPAVDQKPNVVIADDGSPSVYVLDNGQKRHVVDEASLADWRFSAVKMPAAKLAAIPAGIDWPKTRFVLEADGDPAVYVLDVGPTQTTPPTGSAPNGQNGTSADASTSNDGAGCAVGSGASAADFGWLFALTLLGAIRRRDSNRGLPTGSCK